MTPLEYTLASVAILGASLAAIVGIDRRTRRQMERPPTDSGEGWEPGTPSTGRG